MKAKKFLSKIIITVLCVLVFTACGAGNSNYHSSTETTDFLMDEDNVKMLGRTWMSDGVRWCSFSASGVEFTFSGKHLDFHLKADSFVEKENYQARYVIYVDNELILDEMMDQETKKVTVIQSKKKKKHVIRFMKVSDTLNSSLGIQKITCDGKATVKPTKERELKIEFIGDSITCAYGVDGRLEDKFSTRYEDATKGYAYLTAQALDADYSLVSMSGYGMITGFTRDEKKADRVIPLYYDKVGNSYGTADGIKPAELEWDFSFAPDVVVINLGTNDYSYTDSDEVRCQEFVQGYYEFLKVVREKNPNAHIVGTLGIMGQQLCPSVEEAIERFATDTGDEKVHFVKLDVQLKENGYGVQKHPTAASHEHAAKQLTETLEGLLREH